MHSRSPWQVSWAFSLLLAGVWAAGGLQAADRLPQTPGELSNKRGKLGPGADIFGAPAWLPAPNNAEPPALKVTAPPAPPKLPFTYGGSGLVNDKPFLFLERQHGSVLVQLGDVVDGAYRVETLERTHAVLRYLPLDIAQVMAFGPGGMAEVTIAAPAARPPSRGPLIVDVPDEAPLGQEVPVALGIPPGSKAARATVELTYDAQALSVLGAKVLRPGRAVVELSAQDPTPSKQLRLKAIGEENVLTEIGIEVTAVDAQGKNVAVSVPPQHLISLVEAR